MPSIRHTGRLLGVAALATSTALSGPLAAPLDGVPLRSSLQQGVPQNAGRDNSNSAPATLRLAQQDEELPPVDAAPAEPAPEPQAEPEAPPAPEPAPGGSTRTGP